MIALRASGLAGLGIAALLAVWWIVTVQMALDQGQDLRAPSLLLLEALWLTRLLAILLVAPVLGSLRSPAGSLPHLLAIAWYALPLVVLGYAASGAPLRGLLLGEGLLALTAVATSLLARGLSGRIAVTLREPLAWGLGICGAALAWAWREELVATWLR